MSYDNMVRQSSGPITCRNTKTYRLNTLPTSPTDIDTEYTVAPPLSLPRKPVQAIQVTKRSFN